MRSLHPVKLWSYFFNCAKNVNDFFLLHWVCILVKAAKQGQLNYCNWILRVAMMSCLLPTVSQWCSCCTSSTAASKNPSSLSQYCHILDQYHHLLFMYLIAPPLPVTGTTKNLPHIVGRHKKTKNRWMCLRIWIIFYSLMNQLFDQCFPSGGHSTFSFLFHNSVDKSHKISHYTKCQLIFYKTFRHYLLFLLYYFKYSALYFNILKLTEKDENIH